LAVEDGLLLGAERCCALGGRGTLAVETGLDGGEDELEIAVIGDLD
jgi:hypothetical protein